MPQVIVARNRTPIGTFTDDRTVLDTPQIGIPLPARETGAIEERHPALIGQDRLGTQDRGTEDPQPGDDQ